MLFNGAGFFREAARRQKQGMRSLLRRSAHTFRVPRKQIAERPNFAIFQLGQDMFHRALLHANNEETIMCTKCTNNQCACVKPVTNEELKAALDVYDRALREGNCSISFDNGKTYSPAYPPVNRTASYYRIIENEIIVNGVTYVRKT